MLDGISLSSAYKLISVLERILMGFFFLLGLNEITVALHWQWIVAIFIPCRMSYLYMQC